MATAWRDPVTPLLLSLACAIGFVAWSAEPARLLRRPAIVAWLSIVATALLIAALLQFFRWANGELYPTGDHALLEIYTLHAVGGFWTLGPYSQFAWHHPGPLYFYLLAPFYLLSGHKTIALHVGAFAINLLSVCGITYTLMRYAAPGTAFAAVLALGIYLFRLEPVISSYWNPHVVVLPAALYLVLSAALAAGRCVALPLCVLAGSFLVQTHVSLAPYVLAVGTGALMTAARWPAQPPTSRRSLRWWIHASAALLALFWLLPIVEQASHSPGNLTRMIQFFAAPSPGQEWGTALGVWGGMMTALFRTHLHLPEGLPLSVTADASTMTGVWAVVQVLLMAAVCVDAQRRHDRFVTALSAAGMAASITGLWSIFRVKSVIGDYTIFWLSAVGALNWGVVAGFAIASLVGVRLRALQRGAVLGASAVFVWSVVYFGSDQLKRARRHGLLPPRGNARVVRLASEAVLADMTREHAMRPLFQLHTRDWTTAVGVVLQVYKRGVRPAVEGSRDSFFGEPLEPDGREDRTFVITDGPPDAARLIPPGSTLLPTVERLSVYASPR